MSNHELLVTGGAGYVGSHLLKSVSALCLDQKFSGSLSNFNPADKNYSEVRTVVHLADRRLYEINADNLQENISGHANFFSKLTSLPKIERVIFSSSCSVYGFSEEIISENSKVNPTSFYAESKLATEELLRKSGMDSLILRFGTAYGASPVMRDDLFLNELCRAALDRKKIDVYAPHAWRPYIHCQDFARYLGEAAMGVDRGLINVVTENLSKAEVLKSPALQRHGLNYQLVDKGDPRDYRVHVNPRVKAAFTVERGLEDMLEQMSV